MHFPVRWRILLLGLLNLLCLGALPTSAAEPAYLAEMPKPEAVIAKTKGSDARDTQARRAATFGRLITIMREMEGRREFHGQTPGEKRLMKAYGAAASRIQNDVIASLPPSERTGSNSLRAKWFESSWHYEFDDGFQRQIMSTYFSPEFAKTYGYAHLEAVRSAALGSADIMGLNAQQARLSADYAVFLETVPPGLRFLFRAQTWTFLFSLWAIAALGLEFLPFGLSSKHPNRLHVGARVYDMLSAMGRVVAVDRWTTTQIQRTVTTTTDSWGNTHTTHGFVTYYTHHTRLRIDEGDTTREMEFTNQTINLAIGQTVVTWWAMQTGKSWGPYVYFDVLGGRPQYVHAFAEMMRVRAWILIPLLGLLLTLGVPFLVMGAVFIAFFIVRYPLRVARELYFKAALRGRLDIQRRGENIRRMGEATVKTA